MDMKRLAFVSAVSLLLSISAPVMAEEDLSSAASTHSANFLLSCCKQAMNLTEHSPSPSVGDALLIGFCHGMVDALSQLSPCIPNGVTNQQVVRVVVAYIEAHPARMHERFEHLF